MPQKYEYWCPHGPGGEPRALIWGHQRCAWRDCKRESSQLGLQVEDIGNISVKQPEEMSYGESRANIWRKSRSLQRLGGDCGESLDEK